MPSSSVARHPESARNRPMPPHLWVGAGGVGWRASFPIERSGTVDPRTGEPCRGHTDDDRLECVDLTHAFDYTKLALSYLIELSFTLVGA